MHGPPMQLGVRRPVPQAGGCHRHWLADTNGPIEGDAGFILERSWLALLAWSLL